MNAVEKVCLELCEEIFCTSSVTDKTVLNYSVKLSSGTEKTAEVILVTKEDEYIFELDLPDEEVYSEIDSHLHHCSKCASENKYRLKAIQIKGYAVVEFGKVDLPCLKVILEKLAEDHSRCIEENNLEKKNYKIGLFSADDNKLEPFLDVLQRILDETDNDGIDRKNFIEGIKTIENSYKALLESEKDYVLVYGNILENKLFIKNSGETPLDYKILNIRAEQSYSLVYDLLLTIVFFTDQNMRQYHFHDLLDHYYKNLEIKLQKLSLDVTKCLPHTAFQRQVNTFLPSVKLDFLKRLCQKFSESSTNKTTDKKKIEQYKTIYTEISEVNECILYPNLTREDCYKILKNKLGSSDYIFLNYRVIPLQEREGHLGDYFKLKIEIDHDGEVKLLHLFAKYLPTYNEMAKDLALDSFKKEEFYYLKFIPELVDLGLEEITNFLPKCYFSRSNEVIILEDMTLMNYKTVPVTTTYNYEMLLITIKQLAKIHASSLLYEELLSRKSQKEVRIDEKYPEYVEEMTVRNAKETLIKKAFDCAIITFLDMLKLFPDIPRKFTMGEFIRRSKVVFDMCFEKVKRSDKFRNVLCQGDCWASNIFFKIGIDNMPIDCCLVDYQLTRYCPSGHDIYFLMYMATSKEVRMKYESKLLQEYYSELSNIMESYKVDLKKIYTYQEFLDSCEYMRSQGLCHAIIILQYVLYPHDKLINILEDEEQGNRLLYENRDIFIEELQCGGVYGQRMKDLVEEMNKMCENIF